MLLITATRVINRSRHSFVRVDCILLVPICKFTAVGHSSCVNIGANFIQSSMLLPGMHLFITLYLLDIRLPSRCFGIESPSIRTVLVTLSTVVGVVGKFCAVWGLVCQCHGKADVVATSFCAVWGEALVDESVSHE